MTCFSRITTLAFIVLAVTSRTLHAQAPVRARDTLYLDALQLAAEKTDRRASQIEMLNAQSTLRLQTIRNERLPSFTGSATAQYLSDVASFGSVLGGALPGGISVPSPYHDQYDASVTAREPLYDATRTKRAAVENAQAAESAARIHTALWQQRQHVNDAFYVALLNDVQVKSVEAAITDLNARKAAAQQRVDAGSALPSEVLLLDAELLRRKQARTELTVQRSATIAVLASLTGFDIPESAILIDRSESVDALPTENFASSQARPEYPQFARTRDLVNSRIAELSARDKPKVSAFGRLGYGRPGLNPLGRSFDAYWNAGLQLEWSPFNYGRTRRDVQSLQLQSTIVASDEASFTETVKRATIAQRAQISALQQSLPMDDSIVVLREHVLRETRLRFDEGEITSADYIARLTELLSAQLDRDARRVRLNEARARYLTTLGREVR
ncbi:MAG: TolC family protein [Gemmatimonadaceae bacterium]